jgi:hypothetical protein
MRRTVASLAALAVHLVPLVARAQQTQLVSPGQDRFTVGGYAELQLRALADDFDVHDWCLSRESFSAMVGPLGFYGQPQKNRAARYPVALPNTMTDFSARTRFDGLSAIAERDEVFLQVR